MSNASDNASSDSAVNGDNRLKKSLSSTSMNTSANQSSEDLRDLESMYDSPDSSQVLESLILVHVASHVFKNEEKKRQLESMFLRFDASAIFIYLKSFRRARVDFSSSGKAAEARSHFDGVEYEGERLRCYFAQKLSEKAEKFLKPPPLEKQFLISPPTSPPAGWIQPNEEAPKKVPPSELLGSDLTARLAGLMPNATHEVHHGNESQPSVFVHTAAQDANAQTDAGGDAQTDAAGREKPTGHAEGSAGRSPSGTIPKAPKPDSPTE